MLRFHNTGKIRLSLHGVDRYVVPMIGIDIGGANLKAARTDGAARIRPYALWKQPLALAEQLRQLLMEWPTDRLAVTMTGELCDCFATKREGVRHILAAVREAAPKASISVWRTNGRFSTHAEANDDPLPCAAANWLSLATWAGRLAARGSACLIDIGSTTTDIVPIAHGIPISEGRTDFDRLRSGELVYVGIRRTPLCAVMGLDGMAEFFATTHDVFLLLEYLPEEADDCDTADGRPATREIAHARLARMVGADAESMDFSTAMQLALEMHEIITRKLATRIEAKLLNSTWPSTIIISGVGEFLARRVLADERIAPHVGDVISLKEQLGCATSAGACAYAVAVLAEEGRHGP